ncbi:hypothetical protein V3C99_015431 [Haemonchus contortus]
MTGSIEGDEWRSLAGFGGRDGNGSDSETLMPLALIVFANERSPMRLELLLQKPASFTICKWKDGEWKRRMGMLDCYTMMDSYAHQN